jgi:hypothetical protein
LGERFCCSLILKGLENTSQALKTRGKTHQLSALLLENRFLAVLLRREIGESTNSPAKKRALIQALT